MNTHADGPKGGPVVATHRSELLLQRQLVRLVDSPPLIQCASASAAISESAGRGTHQLDKMLPGHVTQTLREAARSARRLQSVYFDEAFTREGRFNAGIVLNAGSCVIKANQCLHALCTPRISRGFFGISPVSSEAQTKSSSELYLLKRVVLAIVIRDLFSDNKR